MFRDSEHSYSWHCPAQEPSPASVEIRGSVFRIKLGFRVHDLSLENRALCDFVRLSILLSCAMLGFPAVQTPATSSSCSTALTNTPLSSV